MLMKNVGTREWNVNIIVETVYRNHTGQLNEQIIDELDPSTNTGLQELINYINNI
jgi:hypothetical protein